MTRVMLVIHSIKLANQSAPVISPSKYELNFKVNRRVSIELLL